MHRFSTMATEQPKSIIHASTARFTGHGVQETRADCTAHTGAPRFGGKGVLTKKGFAAGEVDV